MRSLYFAELTSRYALRKQIVTGVSFFLPSASAAAVIAKAPWYVPVALSVIVAAATAYAIAIGLDRRVATIAKSHAEWNQLAAEYDKLWNHWSEDASKQTFQELAKRGPETSSLAATDAPYDREVMRKWGEHVFKCYEVRQPSAAATA